MPAEHANDLRGPAELLKQLARRLVELATTGSMEASISRAGHQIVHSVAKFMEN